MKLERHDGVWWNGPRVATIEEVAEACEKQSALLDYVAAGLQRALEDDDFAVYQEVLRELLTCMGVRR